MPKYAQLGKLAAILGLKRSPSGLYFSRRSLLAVVRHQMPIPPVQR